MASMPVIAPSSGRLASSVHSIPNVVSASAVPGVA